MKPRWHLAPWDALRAVVLVYTAAATKHGDRGYDKGRDWSIEFDAAQRHLSAWWMRTPADTETKLSHLCNAAARILILISYELRGTGKDDRLRTARPAVIDGPASPPPISLGGGFAPPIRTERKWWEVWRW